MPVWIQLPVDQYDELKAKQPDLAVGFRYSRADGKEVVELHVDKSEKFEKYSTETEMGGLVSVRFK